MPSYDFRCQDCRETFEVQASFAQYSAMMKEKKVACPKCGSKKPVRVFSPPGILAASSRSSGGGCCGGGCACG
ncbi:MAG: zinc ribbon domain-containing protein [Candidatus Sumerlaeota bacterium]|nr:zinc ribbon domain-containing protein [Candidatus Sumerlaeota bacterium]